MTQSIVGLSVRGRFAMGVILILQIVTADNEGPAIKAGQPCLK
jgi:hypothetical protein